MRAPMIAWQLAQTFWVGGLWLLHFVLLPALGKMGLAPLLVREVESGLRPLMIGFSLACVLLQAMSLLLARGVGALWRDLRGQLLVAVLLLGASFFVGPGNWQLFSYLAMACCGLLLVIQAPPEAPRRLGLGASGLIAQQIGEVAVRLGIAAVHQGHLADGLHQFAAGAAAQLLEQRLAVLALGDPQLDLDQLVVHEGALQLGHHPFAEAIVGDGQDRLQVVTDGFELFLLLLRERHNQALMFH